MNNEIKEILDKWKCYIELTNKFTTNEYEMLRVEDIEKALDYITNLQQDNEKIGKLWREEEAHCILLQQENESLRKRIKTIKRLRKKQTAKKNKYKALIFNEEKALQDYKYRCEKAFSYVDNVPISYYEKGYMEDGILISKRVIKNILQNGGDE